MRIKDTPRHEEGLKLYNQGQIDIFWLLKVHVFKMKENYSNYFTLE